jgi:hypothetical protein
MRPDPGQRITLDPAAELIALLEEREALRRRKLADERRLTEIRGKLAALLGDAAHATAGDWEFFWTSIPHKAYSVPEGVTRFVWAKRRRIERYKPRPKVRQRRQLRRH